MLATHSMIQALYTSTGSNHELSHYGLGIERYTHFTSPIRRYADLLVRGEREKKPILMIFRFTDSYCM